MKYLRGICFIAVLALLFTACNENTPELKDSSLATAAKALDWPVTGTVTSNIMERQRPGHNGIDIGASTGTPVYAAYGGKVIKRDYHPISGNIIEIRHKSSRNNEAYVTRYHHLSAFSVRQGVNVRQGQKIGEVGNTGASRGAHLHFEVRRGPANITDGFFGKVIDWDSQWPRGTRVKAKTTINYNFPGIRPDNGCDWPKVKAGNEGRRVKQLQYFLKSNGNPELDVDGKFGPKTEKAVRKFQKAHKLSVDGVVGPDTWSKLTFKRRRGDKGNAVRAIQVGVGTKVDGVFGSTTEKAVKTLQKRNKLEVDGVVGPNTWPAVLFGAGCKRMPN